MAQERREGRVEAAVTAADAAVAAETAAATAAAHIAQLQLENAALSSQLNAIWYR